MEETAEIFQALKILEKANVVQLRKRLEDDFSDEWLETKNKHKSTERKITNKIKGLVVLGLVSKEKVGAVNIYSIKNDSPVKSETSLTIKKLMDIIQNNEEQYLEAVPYINKLISLVQSQDFIQKDSEDISSKKDVIATLRVAINSCTYVDITYKGYQYKCKPLEIAVFEGIYYLLFYYDKRKQFRKYQISQITLVKILKESFTSDKNLELEIGKWHNVWHQPEVEPTKVTLWISENIKRYFYQKNIFDINNNLSRVSPSKKDIEYEIYITHRFELLPNLMYWQPNVMILSQEGDIDILGEYKKILGRVDKRILDT